VVEGRDLLIQGDSADAAVVATVTAAAPSCDLLFLDGGDDYERARADWEAYAPLVRPGGVVAIVDASQAYPVQRRLFDVDRFVFDLERDWLRPRGVRSTRLGGAHAIHYYMQTAATAARAALPWPAGFVPTQRPRRDGEFCGFTIHAWNGSFLAVPGDVPELQPRAVLRNEHAVVIKADTRPRVAALVEAFVAVEPRLATARQLLRQERRAEAAAIAAQVTAEFPGLRAALIPSLEAAPHGKAMLLVLGTLALLGDRPREGAGLLRRALEQDMLDRDLLVTVAAACLQVLQDADAARALLATARQRVRHKKIAMACHEHLSGNVLWNYPQLLQDVRGVIQVGAHTGEEVAAFSLLEIGHQVYIEPQPQAFAELQQRCRQQGSGDIRQFDCAVGEAAGERELLLGERTEHASFLRTHALARLPAASVQSRRIQVPVQTLDQLVATGGIDPAHYNLLLVDTEGTELEVLRSARALLRHIDIVCVAVFTEPVYDGAPLPQQIQTFLREVNDDGFALRAFETGPDPARGDAVWKRINVRRQDR